MFKLRHLIWLPLLASVLIWAQEPATTPPPTPSTIQLNFPNGIDIPSFITLAEKFATKPIIYDSTLVKGTVGLEVSEPVAPEQFMPLFRAILEVAGFTLVEEEHVFKVVPTGKAATYPVPILTPEEVATVPAENRMVIQIIPLTHLPADEAFKTLKLANLLPPERGFITTVTGTNMLLILDYASRARFFADLFKRLDVPAALGQIAFLSVEHASATELATQLQTLFPQPVRKTGLPLILADPRSNLLIVRATASDLEEIRTIVTALDVEAGPADIYLHPLQFARAEELAKYLKELFPEGAQGRTGPDAAGSTQPRIIAIPDRNALIISATRSQYSQLQNVLEQLDKRKRQVSTQVALVEVSTDNLFDLGVELSTIDRPGEDPRGFGYTSLGITSILIEPGEEGEEPTVTRLPAVTSGLLAGITKESAFNIPFILHALERDIGANVIATPLLVCDDNSQATFKTADQIPTLIFTTTDTSADVRSFGGFEEAQVFLKVAPSIASEDSLILDIELIVEQFVGQQVIPELPPPKTRRELNISGVTVNDKLTVVVGGLKSDAISETVTGVPILRRIPVLGFFFRRKAKTSVSKTLYMFLTPRIESFEAEPETIKALTQEKLEELEQQGADPSRLPKVAPD